MNDHDRRSPGSLMYGIPDPSRPGRQLLPPDYRCSAYWFALHGGLMTGDWPGDLEFLRELGYRAACLARWHGIPPWFVIEGPFVNPGVHSWPEWVWCQVADAMAGHAADHGDYGPPYPPGHGYWEAGDY